MPLVQLGEGDAAVDEVGGHPVGGGGGVAIDKAAAVGGHGHIQGRGDVGSDGAQQAENVVHQLAAGGPPCVQAGTGGEKLLGGVVVDGQVHPGEIFPGVVGKQPTGGDVHRHHRVRHELIPGQQPLKIGGEEGGGLVVGQNIGRFAQLAQGPAQPGGTAHRVPVGAQVGQNEIAVVVTEKVGGGLNGDGSAHGIHSSSRLMCSLAGLAGLTTLGLRSISRRGAPWSMESSRTKVSSGV